VAYFGGSGPGRVPESERNCRYGPWGEFGRAFRDSTHLAMSKFYAGAIWLVSTGLITAVVIVTNPTDSTFVQAVTVVVGLAVGTGVGLLLIGLVGLLPFARRQHWRVSCGPLDAEPVQMGIWLRSLHWHTFRNLRCVVTDPDGNRRTDFWGPEREQMVISPGARIAFQYPMHFDGAPPISSGRYKVQFLVDVEHGTKPITLAQGHWTTDAVTES
jgi:hypothetical protein